MVVNLTLICSDDVVARSQTAEHRDLEEVYAAWLQDYREWQAEFGAHLPYPHLNAIFDLEDALARHEEA